MGVLAMSLFWSFPLRSGEEERDQDEEEIDAESTVGEGEDRGDGVGGEE